MAAVSRRVARVCRWAGVLAGLAALGYALRERHNPSPCPYSQRRWLEVPRPFLTRDRVRDVLGPRPDDRILEVGPGTGYYTGTVADALESGSLHAVDVQPRMVGDLRGRLRTAGRDDVAPVAGDVQNLPYPDECFDAAFLVLVLGEVPDQDRALAELARVLRPGGRLVVGELLPDPHYVTRRSLRRRARRQGLRLEERRDSRLGYLARFRRDG